MEHFKKIFDNNSKLSDALEDMKAIIINEIASLGEIEFVSGEIGELDFFDLPDFIIGSYDDVLKTIIKVNGYEVYYCSDLKQYQNDNLESVYLDRLKSIDIFYLYDYIQSIQKKIINGSNLH